MAEYETTPLVNAPTLSPSLDYYLPKDRDRACISVTSTAAQNFSDYVPWLMLCEVLS
jgi:hypothetical protein